MTHEPPAFSDPLASELAVQPTHATNLIGIDPGTTKSAYIALSVEGFISTFAIVPNEELARWIQLDLPRRSWFGGDPVTLVIEWVSFYGREIHAGSETFDTCRWVGRFQQAWNDDSRCVLIPRRQVRSELCGTQKAGDAEVRAMLIDRYGGKEKAIGKIKAKGPLYGIASHVWSALAVAVTLQDRLSGRTDGKIPF